MATYLLNAWYVAAWSDEVGDGLFARRILDTAVVLYRQADGKPVALEDRCPHRFAKLSQGCKVDNKVQCIYHGLEFDSTGACVGNALPGPIPQVAKVRAFTVFEQDKMIWIWMGDASLADPADIPRFEYHNDPDRRMVKGLKDSAADYRLYCDNLMDLTHIVLVHPVFQAGGREMSPKSREDGRWILNLYENLEPDQYMHTWNEIRWTAPASMSLEFKYWEEFGKGPLNREYSANLVTPATRDSCHYFWSLSVETASHRTNEEMQATMDRVLDEDACVVEGVQENMGGAELWDLKPILLATDTGAVRVRRKLEALLDAEQTKRAHQTSGEVAEAK